MRPFVEWLNRNNMKGYVGEFGIPKNDQKWVAVMHHFLEYLQMHNIGASYWAAGAWWKDYGLSIQPLNNVDQPQMVAFSKFFNRSLVSNYK
jgi:endoglucanase